MKIGVFTFHKSINYGSVIQSWALQKLLQINNLDSVVIDYEPENYKLIYESGFLNAKDFKSKIKKLFEFRKCSRIQREKFRTFRENSLNLSKEHYFSYSTYDSYNEFDILITGSDQIWNTNILDCDPIYFLPFNFGGRKIAYACSINNGQISDRYSRDWLKQWINDYSFVSIRENSNLDSLFKLTGRTDIKICSDPTLLLKAEDYSELITKRLYDHKYIFMYNMWTKSEGLRLAQIISEKLNLPVYTITNQMDLVRVIKNKHYSIKTDLYNTGPTDFLNLLYYADFVVTDSFHGTAFSIIFNKPFVTINSKLQNGQYKNDDRLKCILNTYGLIDRFIKLDLADNFNFQNKIDFAPVNEKREKLSKDSVDWLLHAIND